MNRRDRRAARTDPHASDFVLKLPEAVVIRFHRRQPDSLAPVAIALWPDCTNVGAARVLRRVADLLDDGEGGAIA